LTVPTIALTAPTIDVVRFEFGPLGRDLCWLKPRSLPKSSLMRLFVDFMICISYDCPKEFPMRRNAIDVIPVCQQKPTIK
jgi:hypothetical protein